MSRPVFWLTGFSGAGKSAIAHAAVLALGSRGVPAIHLDGDELRAGLSADLGFSMEHRTEAVRRAAHIAQLLAAKGLVVAVSMISPLRSQRAAARAIVEAAGLRFVEAWVCTPLAVCQARDVKGLYARATPGLTGVASPYEAPLAPDVQLSTEQRSPEDCVASLLAAGAI